MQLPDKNIYFSFEELTEKWQCTKAELLKHIFNQSLTPSIHVFSMYEKLQIQTNSNGDLRPVPIEDSNQCEWAKGFYYLIFLAAANPYEMGTPFFSSSREPKKGDYCYRLNGAAVIKFDAVDQNLTVTIEKKEGDIFFVREEIERFEREHMCNTMPETRSDVTSGDDKNVNLKSETSYLNVIGAMLGLLLEKVDEKGNRFATLESQEKVIQAIHNNFGTEGGLSLSNLQKKFSEAKKSISSK